MTGIREFARNVSRYVERVATTGRPLVLTRHGRPVAAVIAVEAGDLEDFILTHAPDLAANLRADRELAAGESQPLDQTLAELEAEDTKSRRKPARRN